jgi:tetratricopeptide (TPR) repeat protein
MFSSLNENELQRALLYLEDQDAGFAIAEVNEAALERRAMERLLERLPEGSCGVIDLKQLPPETRPASYIREAAANAPETRAFFILNLPVAVGEGPEAREKMARELNFSRDVLARLDRLLFFFFPTWFVDLVIRHAKDFFDFVPLVFPLKAETEEAGEAARVAETAPADKTHLENRIAFLKQTLASGELSEEEAAQTHEDLGDCYRQLSEYEAALAHFRKARSKAKDQRQEANLDLKIGRIYSIWGRLDEAMALFDRCLAVYEKLEETKSRAITMGHIARILASKGKVDKALKLFQEKLEIAEALEDRREKAVTMGDIANILKNKGEVDKALKLHKEIIEVFKALGDQRERAVTMGDIARILVNKGEVDEALKLYYKQIKIFGRLGDRREESAAQWFLALTLKDRGDSQSALQQIAESYQILAQLGDAGGLSVVGKTYGQMLLEDGDTEKGMAVLRLSRDVYRKLGKPDNAREVEGIIAQFS